MQLASTYQRFLSAERPERKRQALQRRTHRQSRTVELPAQRLEGAECGRPESRLDPYGAQVDVMKTTRRRSSVTTRCTSRALIGFSGVDAATASRSKPWTNSVLAAAAVPTCALTSSKAVAPKLLSRLLLPPRAEAQPCVYASARAHAPAAGSRCRFDHVNEGRRRRRSESEVATAI